MERTQSKQIDSPFFERNKLLYYIDYLCSVQDTFYCTVINHQVKDIRKMGKIRMSVENIYYQIDSMEVKLVHG